MKCRHVKELMGAYLYGDLSPEEMREVRLHAKVCSECREDLRTRSAVIASIGDKLPDLSDADRQRIAWVVEGTVRRSSERGRPGFRAALAFGGVAMVVAGVVAAGMLFTRPPSQRANGIRAAKRRTPAVVTVKIAEEPTKHPANDKSVDGAKPREKAVESEALRTIADAVASAIRRGSGVAVSRHADRGGRSESAAGAKPAEDVRSVEEDQDETNTDPIKLPEVSGPNDARTSTPESGE